MRQYRKSHEANRDFVTRMAELFWNCGHEEQHRRPERVAVQTHTDVYLEAVETATDTQTEAEGAWASWMDSLRRRLQPEILLADVSYWCGSKSFIERKTDTLGLLWSRLSVPVHARQLLKPPCTERYARWCERTAANHRLLLDRDTEHLWCGMPCSIHWIHSSRYHKYGTAAQYSGSLCRRCCRGTAGAGSLAEAGQRKKGMGHFLMERRPWIRSFKLLNLHKKPAQETIGIIDKNRQYFKNGASKIETI